MQRKTVIILILLMILISSSLFFRKMAESNKNRVIIIVSDALRADVLNCYGGSAKTPNIDWLAAQGILFKNAHSTSPYTAPSAISMFTGKYPNIYRNGNITFGKAKFQRFLVPDDELLLGEVLRKAGYAIKSDCENWQSNYFNNMQGFDKIKTFAQLTAQEKTNVETVTGIKLEDACYKRDYGFLNCLLNITEDQPFLFVKWILDPHSPYNPPAKYKKTINIDPSKLSKEIDFYSTLKLVSTGVVKKWDGYEQNYLKELYIKEVEAVDERIGFILNTLRHKNILDKTYIVFTSDHGEFFGEHGKWCHGMTFHEELVKVPLIITGPKIPRGKIEKKVVSLIGLMPTLKELLGVEYEADIQGKSFAGLLSNKADLDDESAYFVQLTWEVFHDAFLDNNYKLMAFGGNRFKLYNLATDPKESLDISTDEPEKVLQLAAKMDEIRKDNLERRERIWGGSPNPSKEGESPQGDKKEFFKQLKSLGYVN